jgi:class 3 adenylate cyclase
MKPEATSRLEAERLLPLCSVTWLARPTTARLDPEDMRDVLSTYHSSIAEVLGRFNGMIARYMGDGVLAYFGYPQAHEDDAEQAVQADLPLLRSAQNTRS